MTTGKLIEFYLSSTAVIYMNRRYMNRNSMYIHTISIHIYLNKIEFPPPPMQICNFYVISMKLQLNIFNIFSYSSMNLVCNYVVITANFKE